MKPRILEGEKRLQELHDISVELMIDSLGIRTISDEQMEKELDEFIAQNKDTSRGKMMGELRRKFLYRKDLSIVYKRLQEKLNL